MYRTWLPRLKRRRRIIYSGSVSGPGGAVLRYSPRSRLARVNDIIKRRAWVVCNVEDVEDPHGNARNTFSKVIDKVVVAVSVAFDVSVISRISAFACPRASQLFREKHINLAASIHRSLANLIFKKKKTRGRNSTVLNFATSSFLPLHLANLKIRKRVPQSAHATHAPCASGEAVDIRDRLEIFYSRPSSFSRPWDRAPTPWTRRGAAREKDDEGARWIVTTLNWSV